MAYATGILDFYHAVQNLWKGAAAWLDGRTTQARRWLGWARHRLRRGNPDGVLADLADALKLKAFLPRRGRPCARCMRIWTSTQPHRLCGIQGTGLAHWQWDGRERLQMADPTTLQGGGDALE